MACFAAHPLLSTGVMQHYTRCLLARRWSTVWGVLARTYWEQGRPDFLGLLWSTLSAHSSCSTWCPPFVPNMIFFSQSQLSTLYSCIGLMWEQQHWSELCFFYAPCFLSLFGYFIFHLTQSVRPFVCTHMPYYVRFFDAGCLVSGRALRTNDLVARIFRTIGYWSSLRDKAQFLVKWRYGNL